MRQLLAKHQDDGLEGQRKVRVLFAKPDGRERIGWHEALKLKLRQKLKRRA